MPQTSGSRRPLSRLWLARQMRAQRNSDTTTRLFSVFFLSYVSASPASLLADRNYDTYKTELRAMTIQLSFAVTIRPGGVENPTA